MKNGAFQWRQGPFGRLWAAAAASALGARISREGVPLTAVLTLGAGPSATGMLAAVGSLSALVAGLAFGPLVDRGERRGVMVAADLGRAIALASIPLLALVGRLGLADLVAAAAVVGALSALFDMTSHAVLPALVARDRLANANAALEAADSVSEVVGPAVAGVLVSLLTAPLAIAVNVVTYVVSAATLAGLPRQAPPQRMAYEAAGVFSGLSLSLADPRVRPLLLIRAVGGLAGGIFHALYIMYAIRTLGLSAAMLGATIAAGGVGALVGAALAPRLAARAGLGWAILACALANGLFSLLIPAAGGGRALAMSILICAQVFGDASGTAAVVLEATARQSALPPSALGRTAGAFAAVSGLALAIGAVGGGALAQGLGIRTGLWVAAAGLVVAPACGLGQGLLRARAFG